MAQIILIGGTSHSGKSSLAARIAGGLGIEPISTDTMGRHPGRPWAKPGGVVKPHLADYYLHEDLASQMASVLEHYDRLQPQIHALVRKAETAGDAMVIEGSAILPTTLAEFRNYEGAILTTRPVVYEARIKAESDYGSRDATERRLIDSFIQRTLRFNGYVSDLAVEMGVTLIPLEANHDLEALAVAMVKPK